ncbi:hypothetical protein JP0053_11450 [Helicobacter pylori]|uniref:hypothetical protein n=1 Tax=Helicobacter pylori TaxID=210 RepID=UPI000957DF65|nr:uncharacterized protein HPF72_0682 [Helicobacter pylori]GHP95925.1 hypothetical protein JP0053_11450 [Helicobacter pylori]
MAVRFGVIFITDNYTILTTLLILDNLKSCFIFQNDRPFNLKQYLLGLKEKLGFELMGIFYCENANIHKIELIGNDSDFREVLLRFVSDKNSPSISSYAFAFFL